MPGRWLFWFLAVSYIILAQNALEGAVLVQALQKGGYVIYFRHADTDGPALQDYSKQRTLSQAGRDQAQAIGEAFRALQIPVNSVLAEDWAKLAAR